MRAPCPFKGLLNEQKKEKDAHSNFTNNSASPEFCQVDTLDIFKVFIASKLMIGMLRLLRAMISEGEQPVLRTRH